MTYVGSKALPVPLCTTEKPRLTPLALLRLLRPGQWPKNLMVVPLPLLVAGWNPSSALRVALATCAFIVASSLVYVVNDIADRKRDRLHPVKRHRAIASGQVSVTAAVLFATVLTAPLSALVMVLSLGDAWPVLAYLGLNAAYSWKLKHLPLLDVFTVATGFVLRLLGGYEAAGVPVAGWLVLCVLALCLVLILGKRRHELATGGSGHRPALSGYSANFLDHVLVLCSVMTVVTYLLFLRTETFFGPAALLTAPCALFALFRYLQIVIVQSQGGNPVRILLRDPVMVANSAVWLALIAVPPVLGKVLPWLMF